MRPKTVYEPSPLEKAHIKELIQCATLCYDRGWCHGTAGNFSARFYDGFFWQSPSGWSKGSLNQSSFIPIDVYNGVSLHPLATLRPSLEMPVHRGIYLGQPGAKAVVHAHPPQLVAFTMRLKDRNFAWSSMEMLKAFRQGDFNKVLNIEVLENLTATAMLDCSLNIASHVTKWAQPQVLILKSHGVYAWGQTPFEALSYIEALEFCCMTLNINEKT